MEPAVILYRVNVLVNLAGRESTAEKNARMAATDLIAGMAGKKKTI